MRPDAGTAAALIDELTRGLRDTAESAVPWFLGQMPEAYFRDTDAATRAGHLRAIIAARASGLPLQQTLRSEDGATWTFLHEGDRPGLLCDLLASIPTDRPLRAAKVHTSTDGRLVLDVFELGDHVAFDVSGPQAAARIEAIVAHARGRELALSVDEVRAHLARCGADYVATVSPYRVIAHKQLIDRVDGSEGTAVELDAERDPDVSRIVLAVAGGAPRPLFERVARYLAFQALDIRRANLDLIDAAVGPGDGAGDGRPAVRLLTFLVRDARGRPLDPDGPKWASMRRDLRRLKWLPADALQLAGDLVAAAEDPDTAAVRRARAVPEAEVLLALCHLAHQILAPDNPHEFSRLRLLALARRQIALCHDVVGLFLDRFDPADRLGDEPFVDRERALRRRVDAEIDAEDARRLLGGLLDIVVATTATNAHLEGRFALALRLDPGLLARADRPERPRGVLFVQGRSFEGFHVRFRDIARGGLRVVRTAGPEQHALESERLYEEAYGLAFAQQQKNKDIPEGGAKGVLLLAPAVAVGPAVKAFADALLDLTTPDAATRRIVETGDSPQLLYLGPDENISPRLIEWIVRRAGERGITPASVFMSSKPRAGINHKTYGVTSEGVVVFLEVALRAAGIDPRRQPFTVKLTGGPDGDVAGNCIRILIREYGARVRFVGIADGTGYGEDPDGLDPEELLALTKAERGIAHFDRSRLGPRAALGGADEPGGVKRRNTLHLRVAADAFVPAGGRPRTLHEGNWRRFLDRDGRPTSRVIVEGANLFLTAEARAGLSEAGVLIVPGSSANKCGVICSSFEILASMVLTEETFLGHKDRFVAEVLARLRELARLEAELLFAERRRNPSARLPDLSARLSRIVNRATDAIQGSLGRLADLEEAPFDQLADVLRDHLPPVLLELAGESLVERLPAAYLQWTIACALATRIVYREGLEYLETMPDPSIPDLALRYLGQERETAALIDAVSRSDLPERGRIAELLRRGGTRSGLAW